MLFLRFYRLFTLLNYIFRCNLSMATMTRWADEITTSRQLNNSTTSQCAHEEPPQRAHVHTQLPWHDEQMGSQQVDEYTKSWRLSVYTKSQSPRHGEEGGSRVETCRPRYIFFFNSESLLFFASFYCWLILRDSFESRFKVWKNYMFIYDNSSTVPVPFENICKM